MRRYRVRSDTRAIPAGAGQQIPRQSHQKVTHKEKQMFPHKSTIYALRVALLVIALTIGSVPWAHAQTEPEMLDQDVEMTAAMLDEFGEASAAGEAWEDADMDIEPGTSSELDESSAEPVEDEEIVEDEPGDDPDQDEEHGDEIHLPRVVFLPMVSSGNATGENITTEEATEGNIQAAEAGGTVAAEASLSVQGDFNGDGFDDLAIGVRYEDLEKSNGPTVRDGGVVNVIYGSSVGVHPSRARADQILSQDSPFVNNVAENDDWFGSALAAGDFNRDGYDDLAIGVPFEDLTTSRGTFLVAGAVNVIYGSRLGLHPSEARADQFLHQDSTGIYGNVQTADTFGSSLTSGDFNNDGYADLAIGVPGEDINGVRDVGAVNVIYGSDRGLHGSRGQRNEVWHQNQPGIDNFNEQYDRFGTTLAAGNFNGDPYDDLAVGVPYEDIQGRINAGAVNVIHGSANGLDAYFVRDQLWYQNRGDIGGTSDPFDYFGWALAVGEFGSVSGVGYDDLAIGVPYEDVCPANSNDDVNCEVANAGQVDVIYGSSAGLTAAGQQHWDQDSRYVANFVEAGDQFGRSLAAGNFNRSQQPVIGTAATTICFVNDRYDDLAIGVPYEDYGTRRDTGGVNVIYGSANGLHATTFPDQFWTQESTGIVSPAEANDSFGASLAVGDFDNDCDDDLVVGVPFEDVGRIINAGAVHVIYGSGNRLNWSGSQFWHQNSRDVAGRAEANDYFGLSVR